MTYNLSIDYEEFMRSYSMISNVSIDKNLFLNLSVKNNIDLAAWCENAYETAWGFVPHAKVKSLLFLNNNDFILIPEEDYQIHLY